MAFARMLPERNLLGDDFARAMDHPRTAARRKYSRENCFHFNEETINVSFSAKYAFR